MTVDRAALAWSVAKFASIGWSPEQWEDLHDFLTATPPAGRRPPGADLLVFWLRHPPREFTTPVSAAAVRGLFDRHGTQTVPILNAMTAGTSERFAVAYLHHVGHDDEFWSVADAWAYACKLGLTEPHATGWALTGFLAATATATAPSTDQRATPHQADWEIRLNKWLDVFGPDAYLQLLAGFTFEETTAMRDAGAVITVEQLRVMAALNGHTLPAGV